MASCLSNLRPMAVEVIHRRGQPWSFPHLSRPSILGDGLLERARSTSLALLGISASIGLGLTAFAVNQGWPLLPGAPIPRLPPERGAVHGAVATTRTPTAKGAAAGGAPAPVAPAHGRGAGVRRSAGPVGTDGVAPGGRQGSRIAGAATAVPVSVPAGHGGGRHSGRGGPGPSTPSPATATAPLSNPAPVESPLPEASPERPGSGDGGGDEGNGEDRSGNGSGRGNGGIGDTYGRGQGNARGHAGKS
jgi:hypothetical protein